MMHFIARGTALAFLGFCLTVAGQAQQAGGQQPGGQQPGGQQPSGQQQPPKPAEGQAGAPGAEAPAPAGPVVSKEEADAYKAIYDARAGADAMVIQLGEAFIAKYPMSPYAGGVYGQLTTAYLHTDQEDKMFDAGNKALALMPDSIDVLPVMAWAIPRRVNSKTPDGPQQLQKAEGYARKGIQLLMALVKPVELDEAAFTQAKNEKLSMCYSGLGTADIKRGKYAEAAMSLQQAVALVMTPDPVDLYLLGLAQQMTNHFTDATAAFTKCAAASGPMQAACKSGLDETKKKAQNSLEAPK